MGSPRPVLRRNFESRGSWRRGAPQHEWSMPAGFAQTPGQGLAGEEASRCVQYTSLTSVAENSSAANP